MALIGYELVIVVIILVALFFWGPKKLPELAKSLAEAKKEFRKASSSSESRTQPEGN
jgi:TatA/E family protein of Tat protein translocase